MSVSTAYYKYPDPSGWVTAFDGLKLPYYINGTGFETVFFFNGFSCCQPNLKFLVEGLSDRYRVVTWDYRGHGLSGTPENFSETSFDHFMKDAETVMDAIGIDSVHIVGYSMGAQMMFEFTRRHPHRVQSLISLNGTTGRVFDNFLNTDLFASLVTGLKISLPFATDFYRRLWRRLMSVPFELRYFIGSRFFIDPEKCNPEDIRPFLDQLANLDGGLLIHLAHTMHEHSNHDYLHEIHHPVLFLAGERDQFAPVKVSREARDKMRNARLVVIPDGTHNANIEQPRFITSEMLNFLRMAQAASGGSHG